MPHFPAQVRGCAAGFLQSVSFLFRKSPVATNKASGPLLSAALGANHHPCASARHVCKWISFAPRMPSSGEGAHLDRLGDLDGATAAFQRVIELKPHFPEAPRQARCSAQRAGNARRGSRRFPPSNCTQSPNEDAAITVAVSGASAEDSGDSITFSAGTTSAHGATRRRRPRSGCR
jgi:hypothetical protein